MSDYNQSNGVRRTDDESISQGHTRVVVASGGIAPLQHSPAMRPLWLPRLLPMLIGACGIGFGLISGLFFSGCSMMVLLDRPAAGAPFTMFQALLALMALFCLLQIPAGIGILLHHRWGQKLADATAHAALISAGLGMVLLIVWYPTVVTSTFL